LSTLQSKTARRKIQTEKSIETNDVGSKKGLKKIEENENKVSVNVFLIIIYVFIHAKNHCTFL